MIKSGYNMATIPDKRPGMFNVELVFASPCPLEIQYGLHCFSSATMCRVLGKGGFIRGYYFV